MNTKAEILNQDNLELLWEVWIGIEELTSMKAEEIKSAVELALKAREVWEAEDVWETWRGDTYNDNVKKEDLEIEELTWC
jgi:hypothetical protein